VATLSARNAQIAAALFITFLIVSLHLMAAGAGPLWRDEANTVTLATLPHLADIWKNLQFDSFPILWPLIVRTYASLAGAMNDPAFRLLGFMIGVGIVAALWLNARAFGHSIPLVSLAILGVNAHMIRWGDTMRGYGFGIFLFLMTSLFIWRFLEQPSARRFVFAAIVAVCSVNVLYYNAVLLLALCAGGFAVALIRRDRRAAAMIAAIGLVAAISMIPSIATIRAASRWNVVLQVPIYTFARFWNKLGHVFQENGSWMRSVWAGVVTLAAISGVVTPARRANATINAKQRDAVTFALVVLIVGVPANYAFLKILSYYTEPWYYFALIALTALCADVILGATIRNDAFRIAIAVAAVILAGAGMLPASRLVRQRVSDLDIVAAQLARNATSADLILVTPWEYGITFNRYYRGDSRWMTVPPVESHNIHRYDQLFALRQLADQTLPARIVNDSIKATLERGGRVFVVGGFVRPSAVDARQDAPGANEGRWSMLVGQFLDGHTLSRKQVPLPVTRVVSRYELAWVQELQGWKP
jgi:hypothetical protein